MFDVAWVNINIIKVNIKNGSRTDKMRELGGGVL